MPVDLAVIGKGQDRVRGEVSPVVTDHCDRFAAVLEQGLQLPRHTCAGQGRVGDQGKAFPRAVVHHGHDPETAAIGQR